MTPNPPIVFFGSEAWGVASLRALAAELNVIAIVTRPDAPAGRKRVLTPTPVKQVALELGIPVHEPDKIKELLPWLETATPALGVLIAYGKIIPQSVIDAFPLGIINLHPSALPLFRGPSPIEAAILAGAPVGDVSIIQLEAGMDSGPIVRQERLELANADAITAIEAYAAVGELAPPLLVDAAKSVIAGTAKPQIQDDAAATFSPMITKADSPLDCTKSANELARQVRAYAGWPGSEIRVAEERLIITAAHASATTSLTDTTPGSLFTTEANELALATSDGALIIDRLIVPGKNETTGQAYLAGRSHRTI